MLFMGCASVKAPAQEVCQRFEKCLVSMNRPFTLEDHDKCLVEVNEHPKQELQVIAFDDCKDLPPCAFSVCMQAHMRAAKLALELTKGK